MQQVIDIQWWQLGLFSLTLLLPFTINALYQLKIGKEAVIGLIRMVVQLFLVGLYLEYLFTLNNLWINLVWLLVMLLVGSSAIISKARLPRRPLFLAVFTGLCAGLLPLLGFITVVVVQPTPYYHAQYLIPLAGMLLGNSLNANIVCLQHFFDAFKTRWSEYEAALSLGAPVRAATQPFVQNALQKALAPILATMATAGLVSLPGMMTGQILGGASPMVAIKYQVMIMIAVWAMMSVSITMCLFIAVRNVISPQGRLNSECLGLEANKHRT
ncbi:ABC transporter permease [Pseudoalteromonas sp. McH1-42]|uniref:ABC transporter permease n=1 Tax=Pseudoalteromonas sp. McH1-42 TaxID=2917752 RepID=UPI001EF5EE12|nr:ABC transporter permease [Pseudoalteromonas sp. McH1-42]MCG7563006.1 ABC transporter permease [Pseudoalteromonas sp. McH1-42]